MEILPSTEKVVIGLKVISLFANQYPALLQGELEL
jgi:hypothetical protein